MGMSWRRVAVALLLLLTGCGAMRSIVSPSSGTVSSLWPDVPPFPEANKADLPLPNAARIVIESTVPGRLDAIAYGTPKLPPDVMAYYTVDRMSAAGWSPGSTGCVGDRQSPDGGFCFFVRKTGEKTINMIVVISRDAKDKPTSIYYVRVDPTVK